MWNYGVSLSLCMRFDYFHMGKLFCPERTTNRKKILLAGKKKKAKNKKQNYEKHNYTCVVL